MVFHQRYIVLSLVLTLGVVPFVSSFMTPNLVPTSTSESVYYTSPSAPLCLGMSLGGYDPNNSSNNPIVYQNQNNQPNNSSAYDNDEEHEPTSLRANRFSKFAPDANELDADDFRSQLKENMKADLERRRAADPTRGNQITRNYLEGL
jgi:hypothetical protein